MKNLNLLLTVATLMILLCFANSGFRLIADVFKSGVFSKVGVIVLVGAVVVFFVLFLVKQIETVNRPTENESIN